MRIQKSEVDVRLEVPGVVIRQRRGFGDATGLGAISGEYFTLAAGVDTAPVFEGLEGDRCQCPHWGFVLSGRLTAVHADGEEETVTTHDLFYWPAGHNVRVEEDSEIVMFSPQAQHSHVIEHMAAKLKG